MYRMAGRSTATGATANAVVGGMWNPHTTQRCRIAEIHLVAQGAAPTAGNSLTIRRSTARGTASSSVTPDIDNDIQRMAAPVSGATLDLAYSGQPTLDTSILWQWNLAAVVGSGVILPMEITVPPGTGLCICQIAGVVTPACDISIAWREEW
jgi:hypothetical protein